MKKILIWWMTEQQVKDNFRLGLTNNQSLAINDLPDGSKDLLDWIYESGWRSPGFAFKMERFPEVQALEVITQGTSYAMKMGLAFDAEHLLAFVRVIDETTAWQPGEITDDQLQPVTATCK